MAKHGEVDQRSVGEELVAKAFVAYLYEQDEKNEV